MALIHCPECGKQISDQAKNCPGCGYPINQKGNVGISESNNSIKQDDQILPSNPDATCCWQCDGVYLRHLKTCPSCGSKNYVAAQKPGEKLLIVAAIAFGIITVFSLLMIITGKDLDTHMAQINLQYFGHANTSDLLLGMTYSLVSWVCMRIMIICFIIGIIIVLINSGKVGVQTRKIFYLRKEQ